MVQCRFASLSECKLNSYCFKGIDSCGTLKDKNEAESEKAQLIISHHCMHHFTCDIITPVHAQGVKQLVLSVICRLHENCHISRSRHYIILHHLPRGRGHVSTSYISFLVGCIHTEAAQHRSKQLQLLLILVQELFLMVAKIFHNL